MSPSPKNDAEFVNHHPGIERLKSGTWIAKIQHPISKVWVLLGTYTTPEEAENTYTRKKLEYESCYVQKSMPSSFHTSIKDFEKHPGVRHRSGKWTARICHNHERIYVGVYTTPREAAEAYILSKLELNSQKTGCSRRESGSGSVYQVGRGKWKAVHKRGKIRHHLGTFTTPEDAQEAINKKRRELGLKAVTEKTWVSQQTEIGNPVTKTRAHLGTLDSAHEADEGYNNMMCEFDVTVHGHKKSRCEGDAIEQGKSDSVAQIMPNLFSTAEDAQEVINLKRCELGLKADTAKTRVSQQTTEKTRFSRQTEIGNLIKKTRAHLGTLDSAHEADQTYNNMMREFDIMVHAPKKSKCEDDAIAHEANQAYINEMCEFDITVHAHKKSRCEDDAIAHGKGDSTCLSDEISVPTDGSSVIKAIKEEEHEDRMIDVNAESVPMCVTEIKSEFDSAIVDSYGQLVAQYSWLDDDLWLCRYEDDVPLGHNVDHKC